MATDAARGMSSTPSKEDRNFLRLLLIQCLPSSGNEAFMRTSSTTAKDHQMKHTTNQKAIDKLFEQIALEHLFIETLETRNMDSLDFHDVSVRGIKSALQAAFDAGRQAANTTTPNQ
jgi:hypothetical protein